MPIRFDIQKGGDTLYNVPGTYVMPNMIAQYLIDIREIKTPDWNPNKLDHFTLRLERNYVLTFVDDPNGPRVQLYVPIAGLDTI